MAALGSAHCQVGLKASRKPYWPKSPSPYRSRMVASAGPTISGAKGREPAAAVGAGGGGGGVGPPAPRPRGKLGSARRVGEEAALLPADGDGDVRRAVGRRE